jgi:hypothetical protein
VATLTPEWLQAARSSIEPSLSQIQRLALEQVWLWFDDFWSEGMVATERLEELREEIPHRLLSLVSAAPEDRDRVIGEIVAFLRSIG